MISALTSTSVLTARNFLQRNQAEQSSILERLATGKKINSGKDGPAALITAEQLSAAMAALEAETRSLQRADANATIADGYVGQLSGLMSELNGLVVAGANEAGMSDAEREAYQLQIDSVVGNIQRIVGEAGSALEGITLPDGGSAQVQAFLDQASAAVATLQAGGANSLASGNFEAAQESLSTAMTAVTSARGKIGSYQKYSVQSNFESNQIAFENLAESRSRILDTDYAVETSNLTRANILVESGTRVLKIAQQQAEHVLTLLS